MNARAFAAIVGDAHLVDEPAALAALSADRSGPAPISAALAVAPGSVPELQDVVRIAHEGSVPVVVRGAARSYTGSHQPTVGGTLLLETRRLDRVVDVVRDDLYVTVEVGCTWERLFLATQRHDVRPSFFGTLSGRHATVGGTISQNAVFFGSARHGTAADSVLGLDVILADGTLLPTGSHARSGASPFSNASGPNLTGLFLSDSGTLGIKARATLALVPSSPIGFGVSFATPDGEAALAAIRDIAALGVADEVFAFDPSYSPLLVEAGFSFVPSGSWTIHVGAEAHDRRSATALERTLREVGRANAREIDPSIPVALRTDPFGASRAILGARPPRGLPPVHAIVAHSRGRDALSRLEQLRREMTADGRFSVGLIALAAGRSLLLEPTISVLDPITSDDEAARLRERLARALDPLGAVHLQLGKYYPYAETLDPAAQEAIRRLKSLLDPNAQLNPGALGL